MWIAEAAAAKEMAITMSMLDTVVPLLGPWPWRPAKVEAQGYFATIIGFGKLPVMNRIEYTPRDSWK